MKALIIIDVQNDFMPTGALPVKEGDQIIPFINAEMQKGYDLVVATQDWHPATHKSFASQHKGKKPFDVVQLNGIEQILWPDHCVQGTFGAQLHKDLDIRPISAIFRKGMNPEIDSYSAFFDNNKLNNTGSGCLCCSHRRQHVLLPNPATDAGAGHRGQVNAMLVGQLAHERRHIRQLLAGIHLCRRGRGLRDRKSVV